MNTSSIYFPVCNFNKSCWVIYAYENWQPHIHWQANMHMGSFTSFFSSDFYHTYSTNTKQHVLFWWEIVNRYRSLKQKKWKGWGGGGEGGERKTEREVKGRRSKQTNLNTKATKHSASWSSGRFILYIQQSSCTFEPFLLMILIAIYLQERERVKKRKQQKAENDPYDEAFHHSAVKTKASFSLSACSCAFYFLLKQQLLHCHWKKKEKEQKK